MSLYYAAENGSPEDEEVQWIKQQPDSEAPIKNVNKGMAITHPADLANADADTLNDIDDSFFNGLIDK